ARAGTDRPRSGRRAPADGLPGRAREREEALRQDERQEGFAARRLQGGWRRRADPRLRIGLTPGDKSRSPPTLRSPGFDAENFSRAVGRVKREPSTDELNPCGCEPVGRRRAWRLLS